MRFLLSCHWFYLNSRGMIPLITLIFFNQTAEEIKMIILRPKENEVICVTFPALLSFSILGSTLYLSTKLR